MDLATILAAAIPLKTNSFSIPLSPRSLKLLSGPWPVVGLLACYLALGTSAVSRKTVTGDEGTHLLGGFSYWALNDYRLNPESGNGIQRWAALPVWLAGYEFPAFRDPLWVQKSEYDLATQFLFDSGNDPDRMLMLGRLMTGLLGAALGLVVYLWSRRLFGPLGGLLSLALFAFSPTMLTHGFLVLADLSLTLFLLASVGALWMLMHRLSFGTLALGCCALAGLFLSKVSAVTVLPMVFLLLVVRLWNPAPLIVALPRPSEINGLLRKLALLAGALLAVALGIWLLIWASYGFRYAMHNPSIDATEQSPALFQQPGMIADLGKFAAQHHLFPQAFLYSYSYMLSRTQGSNAFLNGEFSTRGWLGFFPYCVAVKTPLELFLILALAAAAMWRFRWRAVQTGEIPPHASWRPGLPYNLAPLAILFSVYWAFALTSHFNIGHRHVLETYPPMLIFAGAAAWWFQFPAVAAAAAASTSPARPPAWSPAVRGAIVLALLLSVAEALWFWPNYLAYFNLLIGGPANGYKHLVDSSLDWSQDAKELARWFDAHPDEVAPPHPVYVSFFGGTPLDYYGILATKLPSFASSWQPNVEESLHGGTYCISATELQGVLAAPCAGRWNKRYEDAYQVLRHNVDNYRRSLSDPQLRSQIMASANQQQWNQMIELFERLRFRRLCSFLRQRRPDEQVGYSILIYRLTDADVAQALDGPPIELLENPEGSP